ncbi:MAG TPA: hypothetical protein VER39_14805 [Nocardioidaceae bacterium]|nr:hypothetical protein [Nocardioidaceae bacterium]
MTARAAEADPVRIETGMKQAISRRHPVRRLATRVTGPGTLRRTATS